MQNGAACADSTGDPSISVDAYQCACVAGYANGMCDYDFITEYTNACTVTESQTSTCVDDRGWTDSTGVGCDGYGRPLEDRCRALAKCSGRGRWSDECGRMLCVPGRAVQLSGNCDIHVDRV